MPNDPRTDRSTDGPKYPAPPDNSKPRPAPDVDKTSDNRRTTDDHHENGQ